MFISVVVYDYLEDDGFLDDVNTITDYTITLRRQLEKEGTCLSIASGQSILAECQLLNASLMQKKQVHLSWSDHVKVKTQIIVINSKYCIAVPVNSEL